jgi:hypothetical protein
MFRRCKHDTSDQAVSGQDPFNDSVDFLALVLFHQGIGIGHLGRVLDLAAFGPQTFALGLGIGLNRSQLVKECQSFFVVLLFARILTHLSPSLLDDKLGEFSAVGEYDSDIFSLGSRNSVEDFELDNLPQD